MFISFTSDGINGDTSDMVWKFYNYGLQAAFETYVYLGRPFSASLLLKCNIITSILLQGGAVMPGTEMPNLEPCSVELCSLSAVLANVTCGPEEVCQADNTNKGLTDLNKVSHDRCTYSLMEPEGSASFNLMAAFRERRRTDVPLLDHLILSLPGVTMYLEQGGRVRVGGEALVLSSTAQLMHGVELSKDQTGVTAKFPSSNMTLFLMATAHICRGFVWQPLQLQLDHHPDCREVLYQPPWVPLSLTDITYFCEIQYQDSVDSAINCNRSTDHSLLRLSRAQRPEPYISACTHTLCRYPSVDGVDCHFLEAYAKACSLEANVTLEDWSVGVSLKCRCVAGDPTVCRQDSASVVLAECLLDDKGIDFSTLHLKDPSCKGHMDPQSHLVTFSFDSSALCGTEVMRNNSQIVYKNSIMSSNSSSVIIRSDQFQIDFSCLYTQPEDPRQVSVTWSLMYHSSKRHTAKLCGLCGAAACIWRVELHSDDELLQRRRPPAAGRPEHGDPAEPGGLAAAGGGGLEANMVAMVTDSCWATNQASPDSNLKYDLIINGCPNPADDTVQMQGNGQGTSSVFSFAMFEFSGGSSEIYLHCKLELCPTQGQACTPSCGGAARRRRRSAIYAEGNAALITMGWRN
ncbi:hypothetical protein F7725_006261 [Dissostichus mawsoni]|uniref:ZP domain-containing protein n=1 Tax=Dissostichus mawsoni TaxID=36200 RepID=A0A7J5YTT2_DISMA|nr:hypothetical protein F7725_006261 [Dissostichus mawsoni]